MRLRRRGAASTLFFTLPESALAIILAIFSGFFLYIGASDLILKAITAIEIHDDSHDDPRR